MSGHSKWANIKNKKGKSDAARGKLFTKIGREIAVSVKNGGPDPSANSKLRDAIAKAKQNNMPNDNIMRSIKKASGELGDVNYEAITYEGYGAGGVAVIVETLTENKNRTSSDIRYAFDKHGGAMGTPGCVSYMFERKGVIILDAAGADEEFLTMAALDAGADDVQFEGEIAEIYADPNGLGAVREKLEADKSIKIISAEIDMIPANYVVPDENTANKINKLLELLEDSDDVQNVYHNAEMPIEEEE